MRHIYIEEERKIEEFVDKAANYFAEHPEKYSYGDLEAEALLALRWGCGEDCVLVLQLGCAEPRIYGQVIDREASQVALELRRQMIEAAKRWREAGKVSPW